MTDIIEPREIGDAEDALLARAEEYPRRPINPDPHFLAVLDELEESDIFSLVHACDETLEFDVDVPNGDDKRRILLKIVDARTEGATSGHIEVVRQDSPSATADVAFCKARAEAVTVRP